MNSFNTNPIGMQPLSLADISISTIRFVQFVFFASGFLIALFGLSLIVYHVTHKKGPAFWQRVTEFTIIGLVSGIASGVANLIQQELGIFGAPTSLLAGGIVGGFLASLASIVAQLFSDLSARRLIVIGALFFIFGILVGAAQAALAIVAPTLP